MAERYRKLDEQPAQDALLNDPGFLRGIVEGLLQHLLEAEITEHLLAAPIPERIYARREHRNGHKPRKLKSKVGSRSTGMGHTCC